MNHKYVHIPDFQRWLCFDHSTESGSFSEKIEREYPDGTAGIDSTGVSWESPVRVNVELKRPKDRGTMPYVQIKWFYKGEVFAGESSFILPKNLCNSPFNVHAPNGLEYSIEIVPYKD